MEETPVESPSSHHKDHKIEKCDTNGTETPIQGMEGVQGGGISLLALCEFQEHYKATVGVPPHTMIGV